MAPLFALVKITFYFRFVYNSILIFFKLFELFYQQLTAAHDYFYKLNKDFFYFPMFPVCLYQIKNKMMEPHDKSQCYTPFFPSCQYMITTENNKRIKID